MRITKGRVACSILTSLIASNVMLGASAEEIFTRLVEGPFFVDVRNDRDAQTVICSLLEIAKSDDGQILSGLSLVQERVDEFFPNPATAGESIRVDLNFRLLLLIMFESQRGPAARVPKTNDEYMWADTYRPRIPDLSTEVEYSFPIQVRDDGVIEITQYWIGHGSGPVRHPSFCSEFLRYRATHTRRKIEFSKQPCSAIPGTREKN